MTPNIFAVKILLVVVFASLSVACDKANKNIDSSQVVSSSDTDRPTDQQKIYRFGFDLRHGPQEDARQYLPLMKYLERETGYRFTIKFTPKNKSTEQMLGEREFDFAAIGAAAFIRARQKYSVVSLVRGLNRDNQSSYRSMLVTLPDSPVKTVEDLRGRYLAFGSFNSTQGHLIPRIILMERHLGLDELNRYSYTGSHRNCVEAVLVKKADACGMQDTLAMEMQKKGLIRVFYTSEYYPSSGIAANSYLSDEVITRVRDALVNFKPLGRHKAELYNWHLTEMPNGFVAADVKDYQLLEGWMEKLGMMN